MWQFDLPNNVANKRHDSKRLDVASTTSKPLTGFWEVSQEPLVKLGRCPMTNHQNNHVLKRYIRRRLTWAECVSQSVLFFLHQDQAFERSSFERFAVHHQVSQNVANSMVAQQLTGTVGFPIASQ